MLFWKIIEVVWSARNFRPRGLERVRIIKRDLMDAQKYLETISQKENPDLFDRLANRVLRPLKNINIKP